MASEEIILRVVQDAGTNTISTGVGGGTSRSSADAINKGMSKNLGLTAISLNQTVELLSKMLGVLSKSSQQLAGLLKLFEKAFMIALRPLGDLISQLLRPVLRFMLKGAIEQMRAARQLGAKSAENIAGGLDKIKDGDIGTKLEGVVQLYVGAFQKYGQIIASLPIVGPIMIAFMKLFDTLGEGLKIAGKWVWDNVLVPIGNFFKEIGLAIGGFVSDVAVWVWDNVVKPVYDFFVSVFNAVTAVVSDVALWVWENVAEPVIKFLKHIYAKMKELQLKVALWVKENVIDPVVNFFKKIWEKITAVYDTVKTWIQTYIIDPIVGFFKKVKEFINKISPSGLYEGAKSAVKSFIGMNDGIITPSGQIVKTNPKDYIIATQNPKDLMGGSKAQTINVNISIQEISSESHIRRLAEEVSRAIQRESSYGIGG
jgi:hypothetical protein